MFNIFRGPIELLMGVLFGSLVGVLLVVSKQSRGTVLEYYASK